MNMSPGHSRLPLPWERPPPMRNAKGQFLSCGNPRGRPSNARLAEKRRAIGEYAELRRKASYPGITPEQFVRLARTAYGKSWQGPLSKDITMSRRALIRFSQGTHKISLERELNILSACLRRVRAVNALVRAMWRIASAAEGARQELARMPRHKPLTRPQRRTII